MAVADVCATTGAGSFPVFVRLASSLRSSISTSLPSSAVFRFAVLCGVCNWTLEGCVDACPGIGGAGVSGSSPRTSQTLPQASSQSKELFQKRHGTK